MQNCGRGYTKINNIPSNRRETCAAGGQRVIYNIKYRLCKMLSFTFLGGYWVFSVAVHHRSVSEILHGYNRNEVPLYFAFCIKKA